MFQSKNGRNILHSWKVNILHSKYLYRIEKNEPVCLMKSGSSFCSFNDLSILNNKTICCGYSCVSGRWQLIWIYFLSLSVIVGFRRNTIDCFRRNTWNSQRNFASRFMDSIWNGAKLWLINVTGFKWKVSTEWSC